MSLEQRVAQLEQEVKELREQMRTIEQQSSEQVPRSAWQPPQRETEPETPVREMLAVQKRPKRSLEELLASWLPKVFMVILLLGVVWGLKVMSDYGFFGDTMKIVSAYALSLAMIAVAYWKREVWSAAAVDSLFGGGFIVGILATAAGAILYDVLSQMTALVIALCYIAYGVAISYVRKNEVLTSFVFFTSLLLPYLLDYMNMSKPVIFTYVVIMFAVMQLVIVKYAQWVALFIGFSLSMWTLTYFTWMEDVKVSWSMLIIVLVMVAVMTQLFTRNVPARFIRLLLFISYGLSIFTLAMEEQLIAMIALSAALIVAVLYVWRIEQKGADVLLPLAVASLSCTFIVATSEDTILLFVLPAIIVSATVISWRFRLKLAAVVLSIAAFFISIIVYMTLANEPQSVMYHMQYVLLLVYVALCYMLVMKAPMRHKVGNVELEVKDIVSMLFIALFFGYSDVIDKAVGLSAQDHVAFYIMSALYVAVLFMPKEWLGQFTQYSMTLVWLLFSLNFLSPTWFADDGTIHAVTQLLITAILGVMLLLVIRRDAWSIFSKAARLIVIVGYMYMMYVGFVNQLFQIDVVSNSVRMMLHTIMLFGVAAVYMTFSQRYELRVLMNLGIALLAIALLKLLIVDLVMINIVIRAVLFMLIGAVGFYLSTLLRKKPSGE